MPVAIARIGSLNEAMSAFATRLPVLPCRLRHRSKQASPTLRNAAAVIASIEAATEAVLDGAAAAVVTNPIAKSVLQEAGFAHPGHTEFLGHLATRHGAGHTVKPVMMLAAEELRVVPLTVHIPLASVAPLITEAAILETARILDEALRRDFAIASAAHRGRRPQSARRRIRHARP